MHGLDLRLRDLPEWYQLSLLAGPPGVRVSVHPAAAEFLCRQEIYREGWYRTLDPKEVTAAGLPTFIPPSVGMPWGFGEVLRPDPVDGWPGWSCAFPHGVEHKEGWTRLVALAASLAELFDALNACDAPIEGPRPQAFAVSTSVRPDMPCYGATIGATVSGWWARCLAARLSDPGKEDGAAAQVTGAIRGSYLAMHGEAAGSPMLWERAFRFAPPRYVFLEAPGNACGLGYCYGGAGNHPSGGYALEPHNTDNPDQQLALLAGLAALSDHLRRDG